MNKSVKKIIGLAAVLAVLGGGFAALMLTDSDKGEESSSESESSEVIDENIILVSDLENDSAVNRVKVTNENGSFTVIPDKRITDDDVFTIEGYEDITLNTILLRTIPNNANGMDSNAIIEEKCTDRAKFGLDSPAATLDISYSSGKEFTLYIGDTAPTGDVVYVMRKGDDAVYTVRSSLLANYTRPASDFVDTTILAKPDVYPIIKSLRIARDDLDTDIYVEYDKKSDDADYTGGTSSTHIMVEPTEAYLAIERSNDIITGMFGLSAESVYCIHCKDEDIAEAGLKTPFCTVTMDCDDGNTYKLLLSEPFNDAEAGKCYYAMIEGANVIFTVTAEKARWATVQPVDIASTIFIASFVWNVDTLSVKAGSNNYDFVISQKDASAKLENPKSSDFNTTLNGADFDSERYREFYSFLIAANAESFAIGEPVPTTEPMASIKYHDKYDNTSKDIEFYDYSAMNALITVNGESKFYISKSFVETLIANAERLSGDEAFVTTWR